MVGSGGITRDLLRRLGDAWEITVVDQEQNRLDQAAKIRTINPVVGDGSSRVVLERAGLLEADAMVLAANDDAVNLEAARLAQQTDVYRVTAVAADPERLAAYRELGITAVSPDSLAARRIEIGLEDRRVTSAAFADGKAEAAEFRITADSPLRGRALADLHLESWLVAAILREGELIVPHGETVLAVDDRVTVVGAARDYSQMVATFTGGVSRFPLDHGKLVVAAVNSYRDLEDTVGVAAAYVHATAAETLMLLHPNLEKTTSGPDDPFAVGLAEAAERWSGVDLQTREVEKPGIEALAELVRSESVGTMVLPRPKGRWGVSRALRVAMRVATPILFPGNTDTFRSILVPARDTETGRRAGRVGIDIAAHCGLELEGVGVIPPVFIAGDEAYAEVRDAVARLREEAAVHGLSVKRRMRQGNPVRVLRELARGRLVVLGLPERKPTFLTPGVVGFLVLKTGDTVLAIPSSP